MLHSRCCYYNILWRAWKCNWNFIRRSFLFPTVQFEVYTNPSISNTQDLTGCSSLIIRIPGQNIGLEYFVSHSQVHDCDRKGWSPLYSKLKSAWYNLEHSNSIHEVWYNHGPKGKRIKKLFQNVYFLYSKCGRSVFPNDINLGRSLCLA